MLAELLFPETSLLGLKMVTVSLGPHTAFPLCEHPHAFSSYQESEKVKVKLLSHVQLFATLWACRLPGSSVHGIFQARVLEWVAI